MNMTGELAGKTILITGASRGIGAAIAFAAAKAGATTLLCARDVPALERIADSIEAAGGPAPLLIPLNLETASLTDYGDVADLIAQRCGCLDGLVFNAAALGELAPLVSYDPVTWARVFQVNVHSVFLMLQTLLPLALASPSSSVLFTLAAEGMSGRPHWGAYGASKFALRGLFEMLAAEHVNCANLRINALLPPPARTRLRQAAFPAEHPSDLADPAHIAPHFIELLSERGQASRGRVVPIPAGMRSS